MEGRLNIPFTLAIELSLPIHVMWEHPILLVILNLNYEDQLSRLYLISRPSFEECLSCRTDLEEAYGVYNNS